MLCVDLLFIKQYQGKPNIKLYNIKNIQNEFLSERGVELHWKISNNKRVSSFENDRKGWRTLSKLHWQFRGLFSINNSQHNFSLDNFRLSLLHQPASSEAESSEKTLEVSMRVYSLQSSYKLRWLGDWGQKDGANYMLISVCHISPQ